MPVPAVLAAGAAIMAGIYAALPDSVQRIAKEEMARIALGDVDEYENEAIKAAFEKIGLDIDPADGLTPQNITAAINSGPLAGTGIELTNLFDREAVKRDITKIAVRYAADAMGFELKSFDLDGIKAALKEEVSRRIIEQVGEGAGDWIELAPDLVEIARALDAAVKAGRIDAEGNYIQQGLMNDDFHVDLRERQARYRSKHTRHWEPK